MIFSLGQSTVEVKLQSSKNLNDLINRWGLAVCDTLSLTLFAAVGRNNHNEGLDLFGTIQTATPFIISWLLVSPFLGAFSREATASKSRIPSALTVPWLVCIPLGLAIRSFVKGYFAPVPFIIVSMTATILSLCLGRYVYLSLTGVTSDEEYKDAGAFEIFSMIRTLLKRW
jgi:hypothetical protein